MRTHQDKESPPAPDKQPDSHGLLGDLSGDEINSVVNEYEQIYESGEENRRQTYQKYVNHYYDLVTDFYEFGWGSSFHFAPRRQGESFNASLLRHQHYIADQLALKSGMQILDVGCGVGGPMAELARHTEASFVGLNNNAYQIKRAEQAVRDKDFGARCRFVHGDYMRIPEDSGRFDGAFAIESMPHAPDKTAAFREILRVLRPGACFAGYDWCVTEFLDSQNAEHARIIQDIEIGNALPKIATTKEVYEALCEAGFELLDARDLAHESDPATPWYRALQGRDFTLRSIPRTPAGRAMTNLVLRIGEGIRVLPKGTRMVSTILNRAADALVEGGEIGIFTPMYFFLARKPRHPDN